MSNQQTDPLAHKAHADLIVDGAAGQLRGLLQEVVQRLDPFPPFPGAFFTFGIELEPAGLTDADRGCVVLGPDGEIYELAMGTDLTQDMGDPVAAREEKLEKLDLHPCDYVVYAYDALTKVVELLLEQAEGRQA